MSASHADRVVAVVSHPAERFVLYCEVHSVAEALHREGMVLNLSSGLSAYDASEVALRLRGIERRLRRVLRALEPNGALQKASKLGRTNRKKSEKQKDQSQ